MSTLTVRFELGQELTQHELAQAFQRIYGRPLPRGRKPAAIAAALTAHEPERFAFEVNRCRGFAWDNGCPPERPE